MILASLLLLFTQFSVDHPDLHDFHVSKCLIEFNEDEASLQLSLHIFIDDLEEGLRQKGHDHLYICTKQEAADVDGLIKDYLKQHLLLSVNGAKQDFQFIGKEISDDLSAVWCYLEITNIHELNELEIKNNILFSAFKDQKNIVSIVGPSQRATLLFQKGQETKEATF